MLKDTVNFRLYNLLKAAEGTITKETIAKELNVKLVSVPVYIHEFLNAHKKAVIENVTEGRKVVGYKLITKDLDVLQFRRNSRVDGKSSKKKLHSKKYENIIEENGGELPVLDPEAQEFSESETADLHSSLGIPTGNNNSSGDY